MTSERMLVLKGVKRLEERGVSRHCAHNNNNINKKFACQLTHTHSATGSFHRHDDQFPHCLSLNFLFVLNMSPALQLALGFCGFWTVTHFLLAILQRLHKRNVRSLTNTTHLSYLLLVEYA
jgi:hypothetical protein